MLLREGVADFIPQPIDRAEVLDVLRSAEHKRTPPPAAQPSPGPVLTFSGATGGAGATTLAVNVAHALARSQRQAKVCLIDLDLQFGAVALQLDLVPTAGLFDIAQARQSFDPSLFLSRWSSIAAACACSRARAHPSRSRRSAGRGECAARAGAGRVRLRHRRSAVCAHQLTETVLSHSDLLYLVTQPTLPAVWQLRRLLDAIETGLEDLNVQLALNRLTAPPDAGRRQAKRRWDAASTIASAISRTC